MSNEQFASAVSQEDKDKINKEIDDALAWIDINQDAEISDFEAKQKELEGKLMPLMQRAYQNSSPGNIDSNNNQHPETNNGPRVEEVD